MSDCTEIARNNAGQRRLLTAHDDIKSVFCRNEIFRHGRQVNPDTRALPYKSGRKRCENGSSVTARRLNAQCAEWSGLDVSRLGDIIIQPGEHLKALLKQSLACLRQYQAMCRAVEKAEPQ